jgi:hypothetical protein
MPLTATYQDYLRTIDPQGNMEDRGGILSPDQWNALSITDQLHTMGGAMSIQPGDPRYDELAAFTKPEQGRGITIGPGTPRLEDHGIQIFNDPSRVYQGDGYHAYSGDNQTAQIQDHNDAGIGGGDDKYNWLKGLGFVAGGAGLATALGAGAGAGAAAGDAGWGLSAGGDAGFGMGGGAGSSGFSGGGSVFNWQNLARMMPSGGDEEQGRPKRDRMSAFDDPYGLIASGVQTPTDAIAKALMRQRGFA